MNQLRLILQIVVVLAVVGLVILNVRLYHQTAMQQQALDEIVQRQHLESEASRQQLADQRKHASALEMDLFKLKLQLEDQQALLEAEKDKRKDIEADYQQRKETIKQQIDQINQSMKQWQKDYTAALAELDEETRGSKDIIKNLEQKFYPQKIAEMNDKLLALQATMARISMASSAAADEQKSNTSKIISSLGK